MATPTDRPPILRLAYKIVESINLLNDELARLAPCVECDGSGEDMDAPCPKCWGRGWDFDNLTEDNGNARN